MAPANLSYESVLLYLALTVGLSCALHGVVASADNTFRWVDDQGLVHYSDRLPPEEAKHPRTKLNQQGMKVEQQEGAKSREQLAREKQVKELRSQQQKLLVEQRDHDLSLLRSFRNEEEMVLALKGKTETIDTAIKIIQSNQERQEELLLEQEKRAADLERRGQQVPKNLRDTIDATHRQISSHQEKIKSLEADKETIKARFDKDIERYKVLTLLGGSPTQDFIQPTGDDHLRSDDILSAIGCQIGPVCAKAWELARNYVKTHTSKPLVTNTERIIHTSGAAEEADVALIVVRVASKTEDTLFLDTRCHLSGLGEELCASPKVRDIRAGFKPFIENGLGVAARP